MWKVPGNHTLNFRIVAKQHSGTVFMGPPCVYLPSGPVRVRAISGDWPSPVCANWKANCHGNASIIGLRTMVADCWRHIVMKEPFVFIIYISRWCSLLNESFLWCPVHTGNTAKRKSFLSCPCRWCEQNSRQVKTVGDRKFRKWTCLVIAVLSSIKMRCEQGSSSSLS